MKKRRVQAGESSSDAPHSSAPSAAGASASTDGEQNVAGSTGISAWANDATSINEATSIDDPTVTDERIARRAYELFMARGRHHGEDIDDWPRAERELRGIDSE